MSVPHSKNQGRHEVKSWDKKTRRYKPGDKHSNTLDVIKTLGLNFHPSWKDYLAENMAQFTRLRKSKRDKEFHSQKLNFWLIFSTQCRQAIKTILYDGHSEFGTGRGLATFSYTAMNRNSVSSSSALATRHRPNGRPL